MPEVKSKLSLTDLKPKQFLSPQYEKLDKLTLGAVIGIATGIKKGKMPDGVTLFEGMSGTFEVKLANGDVLTSGVMYLPEGFMNPILDQLRGEVDAEGEVIRDPVQSVRFAFTVSVERAKNPAGYSWVLTPLIEASANDPLSELRGKLPELALPKPETAADEKGGKGKAA